MVHRAGWLLRVAAFGLLSFFGVERASAASLAISWADNSHTESGFSIESSIDGEDFSEIATTDPDVTHYEVVELQPSTTYWFRVRAFNEAGYSEYSNTASGTTQALPVIVNHPVNVVAAVGEEASFSIVSQSESEQSFRWMKDGEAIPGANSASIELTDIAAEDGGTYTVVISNSAGSRESEGAILTVTGIVIPIPWEQVPTITANPAHQTATLGDAASFSVAADSFTGITYQWRKDGADILGANGASLAFANVTAADAGTYTVVATNEVGSVESDGAVLTITGIVLPNPWEIAPAIVTQPTDAVAPIGGTARFEAVASGDPAPSYQWFKDDEPIDGATSAALVLENLQLSDAGAYFIVASNTAGNAESVTAELVVTTVLASPPEPKAPEIVSQPKGFTLTVGANVQFSASATGEPMPSFQWMKDGAPIFGANATTLVLTNLQPDDAGVYTVVVENSEGMVESNAAELEIENLPLPLPAPAAPQVEVTPEAGIVTEGESVTLEVVEAEGANATYQWFKDGEAIVGATRPQFGIRETALSDAGLYSVKRTSDGVMVGSAPLRIQVVEPTVEPVLPIIVSQPEGVEVLRWSKATLQVDASGVALEYQWYEGESGNTDVPVLFATSHVLKAGVDVTDRKFWVRVSNEDGSIDSATAHVRVIRNPLFVSGPFGNSETGGFAMLVGDDSLAEFIALLPDGSVSGVQRGIRVYDTGEFQFDHSEMGVVEGVFADGRLVGEVVSVGQRFGGTFEDSITGETAALAGFYEGSLMGDGVGNGDVSILATAGGKAFYVVNSESGNFAGLADVSNTGEFAVEDETTDFGLALRFGASGVLSGATYSGVSTHYVNGARSTVSSPGYFSNMSVRASVGSNGSPVIAGFVVAGMGSKRMLVRGVGPTLADFGVAAPLADPRLRVYENRGVLGNVERAFNGDWYSTSDADAIESDAANVGAFSLSRQSRDAAVAMELSSGAFTAHVDCSAGSTGTTIVELYDAAGSEGAMADIGIRNMSVRLDVEHASDVVIVGFVVTGADPIRTLIRAVGTELGGYGVNNPMPNPRLQVHRHEGASEMIMASNVNWEDRSEVITALSEEQGAFPLSSGSNSAAMELWLEPGVYTSQVRAGDGLVGEVLIEIYGLQRQQ